MKPVIATMRETRHFLLAGEHCVAVANRASDLRRYRRIDSNVESLKWPIDATVVKIRPLRNDQIRTAESSATVASRSTGRGKQLLSDLRKRVLEAMFAEETTAHIDGRPMRRDVALITEDEFIRGLSDADHGALERRREWVRIRSIEICKLAIVEIRLGGDSPTTVRAWSQHVRDVHKSKDLNPDEVGINPALFGDTYPVREFGALADQWFSAESTAMATAGMVDLEKAKNARLRALIAIRDGLKADGVDSKTLESSLRLAEAKATVDAVAGAVDLGSLSHDGLIAMATARGVDSDSDDVEKLRAKLRLNIGKAEYPDLSAAILSIEKCAGVMQYLGFPTSSDMWEEIADHAERLIRLGKRAGTSRHSPS